ncbi:hypothetical protein [Stagnihabitans tardus]|uniref:Uncharacterized protein n=1 Tax=Stagnihabitans tardus TaxID=2699202 RepID=A0AAE5BW02_9RHOB|nr:hypothetical protein [Stagnihabitans tardus]NBZ89496.1 hypothetical protein [Stagnihabitans tardus]
MARRKGFLTDGTYDPDCFAIEEALAQAANLMLFKLVNLAHGHGAIYA